MSGGLDNIGGEELRFVRDFAVIENTVPFRLYQKITIDLRRPRWMPGRLYRRLVGSIIVISSTPFAELLEPPAPEKVDAGG